MRSLHSRAANILLQFHVFLQAVKEGNHLLAAAVLPFHCLAMFVRAFLNAQLFLHLVVRAKLIKASSSNARLLNLKEFRLLI